MDNSKLFGEAANEEQLLKNDYHKYRGENMDIYYNVAICEHAGECVRGNPLVFEVSRKPWIIPDNGDVASNQSVINRCPSGALKYLAKEKN
ncbi:(4Fe-4S)-binding protein [Lactococcus lactis]|uniref:(4Fe-4S)-binding protein n=1 Tax=Lactococcus lactis TaxID=1358 RepID=UPI0022E5C734|nr:(4Fe-4S)-binding protein [Lactococcus lactis]